MHAHVVGSPSAAASVPATPKVRVWDLPVRVVHWLLVAAFFGAWITGEDGSPLLHLLFGYSLAGLVLFRLLWGVVGTRHARFGDFVRGPGAVLTHVRGLLRREPDAHAGHNPLGALAVLAILGLGVAMGVTGWMMAAGGAGESLEELHEALANAFMAVVIVHILGVLLTSVLQRRNLVAGMITGRKRSAEAPVARRGLVALLLLALLAGFWAVSLDGGQLPLGLSAGIDLNEGHGAGDDEAGAPGRDDGAHDDHDQD